MAEHNDLGKAGEEFAVEFLKNKDENTRHDGKIQNPLPEIRPHGMATLR